MIELPVDSISDLAGQHCGFEACATPVCLPSVPPRAGDACWVAGWGLTDYDRETYPESLMSVGLNIFSTEYAWQKTMNAGDVDFTSEFMAGLPDKDGDGLTDAGSDSCSGDSGGPLVCRSGDNLILTGLVSSGIDCGKEGLPGIYANVYSEMEWIREFVGDEAGTTKPVNKIFQIILDLISYQSQRQQNKQR